MSATRRTVLAGVVGAAGVAASRALGGSDGGSDGEAQRQRRSEPTGGASRRQPVVYLPHGGGPWPFVDLGRDPAELAALRGYLEGLREVADRPRALLIVSAHWEAEVPTVMTSSAPPMFYDYSNFPEAAYRLQWPAPGAPDVAGRVRQLLSAAGLPSAEDADRGFDHGAFVPMMLTWPQAEVPALQLSLVRGLDPAQHLALGRALAPLRDEGVQIVASGMSFHNMRAFFRPSAAVRDGAALFADWLAEAVSGAPGARTAALSRWSSAPGAQASHPREEHLLPLMVAAGAAGADAGEVTFRAPVMGYPTLGVQFG